MIVSKATKDRISRLSEQIKWNRASLEEYREYRDILLRYGVPQEKIQRILSQSDFHDIDEYAKARMSAITLEHKKKMNDAIITGALLGLGIGIIIGLVSKK